MNNDPRNRDEIQKQRYEERKAAYIEKMKQNADLEKRDKRHKLILACVFILVIALVIAVAAVVVSFSIKNGKNSTPSNMVFVIGGEKVTLPYSEAVVNGVTYIDMRSLKSILSLTESGSRADVVRFTSRESFDSAVFTDGSYTVSVNGCNVVMTAPAIVNGKTCSVPLATVENIFTGIKVERTKSRITIERTSEALSILAKSDEPLDMIIEFKNNLSEYEKYMNPQGEDRDAYLLLVNKQNPLGENYVPSDLVELADEYCGNPNANQINACAAKAFEAFLREAWSCACDYLCGTSGYRSYQRQEQLYNNYIENEMNGISINAKKYFGEDYIATNYTQKGIYRLTREDAILVANAYSAEAGYSEHQSGLCMDMVDYRYGKLENDYNGGNYFTDEQTFKWLYNNAWKFGFILRYPEDKTDVTGYDYESWHFRFVGRYHAQRMYSQNLTLEEYLEIYNG